MRLLIIEDDATYTNLLKNRLVAHYDVDAALNMRTAKPLLEANSYDAVLLDVGLPDADRNRVVVEVKRLKPSAALIILSGHEDPEFARKAIKESAVEYWVKGRDDLHTGDLLRRLSVAIKTHAAHQLASCVFDRRADDRMHQVMCEQQALKANSQPAMYPTEPIPDRHIPWLSAAGHLLGGMFNKK